MISSYVGSEGNEEKKKSSFSRQKLKVQSVHCFSIEDSRIQEKGNKVWEEGGVYL